MNSELYNTTRTVIDNTPLLNAEAELKRQQSIKRADDMRREHREVSKRLNNLLFGENTK